jgi:hypothetical protein
MPNVRPDREVVFRCKHSKLGRDFGHLTLGHWTFLIRNFSLQPLAFSLLFLLAASAATAADLSLPPRPAYAPTGSQLIQLLGPLSLADREARIVDEISRGNVPEFLRRLVPITVQSADRADTITYYVTPEYLAVGSDADYFLAPLSPLAAQKLANLTGCILPTTKMVNDIYAAAAVKLAPTPIPPTPAMTTIPIFAEHNALIRTQRLAWLARQPLGALVAGHKKDVVVTPRLAAARGKVAIYGWHQTNGVAIQALYLGHADSWVDYSHGIRLVQQNASINGAARTILALLLETRLAGLLSDEGAVFSPRYIAAPPAAALPATPAPAVATSSAAAGPAFVIPPLQAGSPFHEQTATFTLEPKARFHINAPSRVSAANPGGKPLKLVFYALPNGNTIEQTIGKKLNPGDDWHFDIQHIGAQMRFVRELCPESDWVVVYLEADGKSWPAWRKQHDSRIIPAWFDAIKRSFNTTNVSVILSGHSGGGSAIFGFINSHERIPTDVERITFLDSNYAYDETAGHTEKLTRWLMPEDQSRPSSRNDVGRPSPVQTSAFSLQPLAFPPHHLVVIAYHDDIALLNGKTFVSATGGTWGRSHLMKKNFTFPFTEEITPEFQRYTALDGRVKFILKENPEKAVLHTVQVERNGFIHSLLFGTPYENKGYTYFGPRAYGKWIAE